MDTVHLHRLSGHALRIVLREETGGASAASALIAERADGSGRLYLQVDLRNGDDEYAIQVLAPAPEDAPGWAKIEPSWQETRVPAAPRYLLTDLQACEPELLDRDRGVTVHLHDEPDEMGLPSVDLEAPAVTPLLEYVREFWGDEDKEWFEEYVVQRVTLL